MLEPLRSVQKMKHDKLFAKVESPNLNALLDNWKWLVTDNNLSFVAITAMGDLVLTNQDHKYFYLDTIEGKYFQIADNDEEYQALHEDKEFRRKYLQYYQVLNLLNNGIQLSENQCYSPDIPPHLGGELNENNFKPTDIYVHFSMSGQLWHQTKDLKPGTKIDKIVIEAPKQSIFSKLANIFKR